MLMQLPGALAFIERKVIIYCPLYAQKPSSLSAQDGAATRARGPHQLPHSRMSSQVTLGALRYQDGVERGGEEFAVSWRVRLEPHLLGRLLMEKRVTGLAGRGQRGRVGAVCPHNQGSASPELAAAREPMIRPLGLLRLCLRLYGKPLLPRPRPQPRAAIPGADARRWPWC